MRTGSVFACAALLLSACAWQRDGMRVVVPLKTTYLDAEAVDGGTVEVPPRVLEEVRPTAPDEIGRAESTPSVVLRFHIDTKGRVGEIEIARASDDRLAGPAVEAISRWRLSPARRDGEPIPVVATVRLTFDTARLRD